MAEMIQLNELNELPYNPRFITVEEMDELKASIQEHTKAIPRRERAAGYRLVSTITVNRKGNRIIGGHQRIKALQELGQDFIDKRDVTWIELIPDSPEEKALNIALNDPHKQGKYDEDKLDEVLSDIKEGNDELFGKLNFGHFKPDISVPEEPTQSFISDSGQEKSRAETTETPLKSSDSVDFLDDSKKNEKVQSLEDEEPVIDDGSPQLFPFSCALSIEQRTTILEAIKNSKREIETQESSVALTHICRKYLEAEN